MGGKIVMEESSYKPRASVSRSLAGKELLEELKHKNLAAISRARMMDQGDSVIGLDELQKMVEAVCKLLDKILPLNLIRKVFQTNYNKEFPGYGKRGQTKKY